jgi:hypothetical protein
MKSSNGQQWVKVRREAKRVASRKRRSIWVRFVWFVEEGPTFAA